MIGSRNAATKTASAAAKAESSLSRFEGRSGTPPKRRPETMSRGKNSLHGGAAMTVRSFRPRVPRKTLSKSSHTKFYITLGGSSAVGRHASKGIDSPLGRSHKFTQRGNDGANHCSFDRRAEWANRCSSPFERRTLCDYRPQW